MLAACGGGEGADAGSSAQPSAPPAALTLLRVFQPEQPAGVALRLPLAFAGPEGAPTSEVPDSIRVAAVSPSGTTVDPVFVERRGEGIPTPYFPYRATFDEAGTWELQISVGDAATTTELTVRAPQELAVVPGPGDALPSLPTPTTADPLDIDPLCTADPPCPLHDTSLDEALGAGLPVVLLVATPAFCQTAICGPVLDLLVTRSDLLAGRATVLHAEVYTDDRATETAPIVAALGLRYEPSLFVADATGTVTARLDYTFDATELEESLDGLLA